MVSGELGKIRNTKYKSKKAAIVMLTAHLVNYMNCSLCPLRFRSVTAPWFSTCPKKQKRRHRERRSCYVNLLSWIPAITHSAMPDAFAYDF
jgi:hypothetical protein